MKYCKLSRRHFLQGSGGALLALPFLSSLAPQDAFSESPANGKFLIHFSTSHGGISPSDWFPDVSAYQWQASEQEQLYSGDSTLGLDHRMRRKSLTQLLSGGRVSPIFDDRFNALLPKMNLIDGLSLLFGEGHHSGGFLGNFHGTANRDRRTGIDARIIHLPPMPTIDHVMAESPYFYGPGDPRTVPALNLGGTGDPPSFKMINGAIQAVGRAFSMQELFDYTFGDSAGNQASPERRSIMNRVYEDYQRLVSPSGTGGRLSSDDVQVVEQHLDSLNQVERRLNNLAQAASCNTVGISSRRYGRTDPHSTNNAFYQSTRELYATYWDTYVDMIVSAINCGLCRIVTLPIGAPSDYVGDYHQNVAHVWNTPAAQTYIRDAHQFVARRFILPLLERLNDVRTTSGGVLLDNGLVIWQPECWYATHELKSIPTMMAGGAGGYFRTGYYVDYRNLSNRGLQQPTYGDPAHPYNQLYPGLPVNRWLHTVLESMGINRAEYLARSGIPSGSVMYGYGDHTVQNGYVSYTFINGNGVRVTHDAFPQRVIDGSSTPLPFIKA